MKILFYDMRFWIAVHTISLNLPSKIKQLLVKWIGDLEDFLTDVSTSKTGGTKLADPKRIIYLVQRLISFTKMTDFQF